MRIFECAKQAGIKHYVWGSLDYGFKKSGYDSQYRTEHLDSKGRVAEWLIAQPSEDSGLTWSVMSSGPYMDMLHLYMFGPLNKRDDGTFVFASPIGDGHVPMISLKDLGFFARYIFDHLARPLTGCKKSLDDVRALRDSGILRGRHVIWSCKGSGHNVSNPTDLLRAWPSSRGLKKSFNSLSPMRREGWKCC